MPKVEENPLPQPANAARGVAAAQPGVLAQLFNQDVVTIDPDLKPALEDMCSAGLGAQWRSEWPRWLSRMVNDSLRAYLGQ